MKRTLYCGALIVLFLAIAVMNDRFLATKVELEPIRMMLAAVSALFVTIGITNFWGLITGYASGSSSRSAILHRASTNSPPVDGHPIIATGKASSLSAALVAPLSGTPCAAYMYRMYYVGQDSQNGEFEIPIYWGYACKPFAVDSAGYRYRVLAVPKITGSEIQLSGEDVLRRARNIVESTNFETVAPHMGGTLSTVFQTAQEMFTDDTGEKRCDWKREGEDRDPSALFLEETVLPLDEVVSVSGTWSAERGAIVSMENNLGNIGVSVVSGPPSNLSATEGLPPSRIRFLVYGVLFVGLGAAILWFAANILERSA